LLPAALLALLPGFALAAAPDGIGPESAIAGDAPSNFLTTLGDLLVDGGVLMIPIGLASVLTLGLAIERLYALRRAHILPEGLWRSVRSDLETGNVAAARAHVAAKGSALARMLAAGLEYWEDDRAELAAALEEAGQREVDELHLHLPALQGIASIAPLLGLLGTVVGMIQAFYTIAKERIVGNPELFAEPIGMALVTTAAGLTVAIPALVLYYWFRGRIRRLAAGLDDIAREVGGLRRRAAAPGG
jgi:biopolymer transport protein ExbB